MATTNGSGSSGRNGGSRGTLDRVSDALENRIVLLITAALLGIGGNLAIVSTDPNIRADPFTGEQGRALEERIAKVERIEQRIENLEDMVISFATAGPVEVRRQLDSLERGQRDILEALRETHK